MNREGLLADKKREGRCSVVVVFSETLVQREFVKDYMGMSPIKRPLSVFTMLWWNVFAVNFLLIARYSISH